MTKEWKARLNKLAEESKEALDELPLEVKINNKKLLQIYSLIGFCQSINPEDFED